MKVSAVVTTFNRAQFAKKAIESVLAQTFRDFELIVLDNSSSDGTEAMVRGFEDKRIVYIRHEPIGISKARNLGVAKARGDFVGFLDDDDEWLPNKLELQVALFDKAPASLGLVYGGFYRVTSDGEIYDTFVPRLRGNVLEGYLCGHDVLTGSASNPLIRRSTFREVGLYDEQLKTSEDWEFYLRLARKYDFDFVSEPVLKIRQHKGARLGDKLEDAAYSELVMCKKFNNFFETHKKCHSYYLQTIGGKYCRVGKIALGRKYLCDAIRTYPANWVAYSQYLLSFFGQSLYSRVHRLYQRLAH